MGNEYLTIGKSELRKDAWAKVAGQALYVGDIPVKGLCYGAVLRSPHHHARIIKIDASRAETSPQVLAVITAADITGNKLHGPLFQDQPALAFDKVRHMGEPVALVVARTKAAAKEALRSIAVEYELLPAVFDPVAALQSGMPQVHAGGNLLAVYKVQDGDLEAGFAQADIILDEIFTVPRISPAYMEAESSLALIDEDDNLCVWVSSQKPFDDRHHIASVLGLEVDRVRVKSAVVGGAFGGKEDSEIHVLAALAAWITKKPVQLVNSRQESFLAHPKRHPAHIHYRLGARKDGALLALQAVIHMDTGAYASYGTGVAQLLTEAVPGSYRIPNVSVETRLVYTNSPYSGAMRGFGSPQVHFAMESLMDMLASRLGMDAIEIRRKNILKPGDRFFTRVQLGDTALSLPRCLDLAEDARRRLEAIPAAPGKLSGVGLALSMQSMGLGHRVPDDSTNRLEWTPEGQVTVYIGAPDLGQGLDSIAEQAAAEALGLPFDLVRTATLDTGVSPDGGVTCASRMTYMVGNSVMRAAVRLVDVTLDYASQVLNKPRQQLEYKKGQVISADGDCFPIRELAARAAEDGISLSAAYTYSFPYPSETTPGHLEIGMPHVLHCFGGQVVRVEIDPDLGVVEVKDVVAIHDVGKIINRIGVEGQIEGGVSMGIGYALYEDVRLKQDGQWVSGFTEYLIPTAKDMPAKVESIILEIPEQSGPWGAKGVAEIVVVPTAPAIANALFNATGLRVNSIPISPETVARHASEAW